MGSQNSPQFSDQDTTLSFSFNFHFIKRMQWQIGHPWFGTVYNDMTFSRPGFLLTSVKCLAGQSFLCYSLSVFRMAVLNWSLSLSFCTIKTVRSN